MPRPRLRRRIKGRPHSFFFKPAESDLAHSEEVVMNLAEFESLRLTDLLEIPQGEAAKHMEVSQPTLSRTLKSARKKIADAIINGKLIRINHSFKLVKEKPLKTTGNKE